MYRYLYTPAREGLFRIVIYGVVYGEFACTRCVTCMNTCIYGTCACTCTCVGGCMCVYRWVHVCVYIRAGEDKSLHIVLSKSLQRRHGMSSYHCFYLISGYRCSYIWSQGVFYAMVLKIVCKWYCLLCSMHACVSDTV